MWTTQNPTHCPKCGSKVLDFSPELCKKDENGEDTDKAIAGAWFCGKCGDLIGRKMNQYENDVNPDSL